MNGDELKTLLTSAEQHVAKLDSDAAIKDYFKILTDMLSPDTSVDLEARIKALLLSQVKLFELVGAPKPTNDTIELEYNNDIRALSRMLQKIAKNDNKDNQLVYAIFYETTKQNELPFFIYLADPSSTNPHVAWLNEFQQVFNFKEVLIWALETEQITDRQLVKFQNSLAGDLPLDVGGELNPIFNIFLTHYQAWLEQNHQQPSTQTLNASTKLFLATVIKAAVVEARASDHQEEYFKLSKNFENPAPAERVKSIQDIIDHYIKSRESGASRLFRNSALTSEKLKAAKRLSSILEARADTLTLRQLHNLLQEYKSLNASIEEDSGKTYSVFTHSGFGKALTHAETIVKNTARQLAVPNRAGPR